MAACVPPGYIYGGVDLPDAAWENWAGTVQRRLEHWYAPASLTDLVHVVQRCTAAGVELHAAGSGWAFEDVAVSANRVVSLQALNQSLTYVLDTALTDRWRIAVADSAGSQRLFHVEAGITIGALNQMLADAGLAMPTLGGANGQSLGGALSTSTHGGDLRLPPLADVVQAVHLVTAGGQELWIERASEPLTTDARLAGVLPCPQTQVRRDDELLHAAIVAGGRFGVIYSLVLNVVPAFRLAEFAVERPVAQVLADLRAGVTAGTGLNPLLSALAAPPDDLGADLTLPVHFAEILWPSAAPGTAWVRRRWPTTVAEDLHPTLGPNPMCGGGVASAVLIAAAAVLEAEALHLAAIPVVGAIWAAELFLRVHDLRFRAGEVISTGEATALAVNAAWQSNLGFIVPHLNQMIVGGRFGDALKTGRRGPSHLIMTGTPAENVDCYRSRSTEVIFPADTGAYLDFLDRIVPVGPTFRQAGYVSLRYSAPSRALISMHHLPAPQVVSIEIASLAGLEGSRGWVTWAERTAVELGGRPHWGQEHHLTVTEVEAAYSDDLERWREALRSVSGTSRTFSNAFTRRCGLEPAPIPRAATVRRVRVDRFGVEPGPGPETSRTFEPTEFGALEADLGELELGQSRVVDIALENAGTSPLQVSAVLSGDVPPAELRLEVPPSAAATGETADVFLLHQPSRLGPLTGTLTVSTNAPLAPRLQVRLRATVHGARMVVDRPALDFGDVAVGERAEQQVRLRNTGDRDGSLIGTMIVVDGGEPADYDVRPQGAMLQPGQAVTLIVTYAPSRTGPALAVLRAVTRRGFAPVQTVQVRLTGGGLAPVADVMPTTLGFGVVPVRRQSPWQGVDVVNRGTGPLRIAEIVGDPEFPLSAFGPPTLDPGQSCTLLVCFRPAHDGPLGGTLAVRDNAPGSPHVVTCTGTAVAVPLLVADPASLDVGAQPVGTTGGTRTVWITNDGVRDLHLTAFAVGGADPADFVLAPPGSSLAVPLPPEGRRALEVRFAPTAVGTRSAILQVQSDAFGGPHAVPLTGLGLPAPALSVTPTVLEFGAFPVGARSGGRTVTLTNNGPAAVELADPAVVGADAADFAVVGGGCGPGVVLAPGAQCMVDIVFTAAAVGDRTGELQLTTADGQSTTAALQGTGTGWVLAFDPPQTDFGDWAVGSPGPDLKEVHLRNLGNVSVHVAQVAVEGDFVSQDGCSGSVLGPGGYCTVRVRFFPRAEGLRAGRVLAVDDSGGSVVAQLQGTAGAPHAALQPAALNLGDVGVGRTTEGTVTVTNSGTWPLTIYDPVVLGPDAADFALATSCGGAVLPANAACTMRLSVTPGAPGPRRATLRFTSNADARTHEVPLTGTGIA